MLVRSQGIRASPGPGGGPAARAAFLEVEGERSKVTGARTTSPSKPGGAQGSRLWAQIAAAERLGTLNIGAGGTNLGPLPSRDRCWRAIQEWRGANGTRTSQATWSPATPMAVEDAHARCDDCEPTDRMNEAIWLRDDKSEICDVVYQSPERRLGQRPSLGAQA